MFQKYEDEKIFYIENTDQSLTNCSELKYRPRSNPDCEDYSALFGKIPHLRKLNFDFPWFHKSQIPLRLFPEVVSQCQYLTHLEYSLPDDNNLDALVQFVQKSPKILEALTLNFTLPTLISEDWFDVIGEALKLLPKLKYFAIFAVHDASFLGYLNYQEHFAVVETVRNVKIASPNPMILKLVNSHFKGLESLELDWTYFHHTPGFDYPLEEFWDSDTLVDLSLTNVSSITCLDLNNILAEYPFTCAKLFEVLPNIEQFYCGTFNAGNLRKVKSLKKLVIRNGMIQPPNMLLNFPSLIYLSMKWSKTGKMNQIKGITPFVPLHCNLYEDNSKKINL